MIKHCHNSQLVSMYVHCSQMICMFLLLLSFQECMGAEVVESACVVGVPELIKVTHSKLVRWWWNSNTNSRMIFQGHNRLNGKPLYMLVEPSELEDCCWCTTLVCFNIYGFIKLLSARVEVSLEKLQFWLFFWNFLVLFIRHFYCGFNFGFIWWCETWMNEICWEIFQLQFLDYVL